MESSDRGKRCVTDTDVISWFHQLGWSFRYGQASATLPSEDAVRDNISLAKLTIQCTLSVVTRAVGDGVA